MCLNDTLIDIKFGYHNMHILDRFEEALANLEHLIAQPETNETISQTIANVSTLSFWIPIWNNQNSLKPIPEELLDRIKTINEKICDCYSAQQAPTVFSPQLKAIITGFKQLLIQLTLEPTSLSSISRLNALDCGALERELQYISGSTNYNQAESEINIDWYRDGLISKINDLSPGHFLKQYHETPSATKHHIANFCIGMARLTLPQFSFVYFKVNQSIVFSRLNAIANSINNSISSNLNSQRYSPTISQVTNTAHIRTNWMNIPLLVECYLTVIAKNQMDSTEQVNLCELKLIIEIDRFFEQPLFWQAGVYCRPDPATTRIKLEYKVLPGAVRLRVSQLIASHFKPGRNAVAQVINDGANDGANDGCVIA